jgi:integrase
MATIRARPKRDGSLRFTAVIRLKKNGQLVHQEAKTLASRSAAAEWAKRREVELEDPAALIRATARGCQLKDLIRWYIDSFREVGHWGRTKNAVLQFLEKYEIGKCDALELTTPILIHHIKSRRLAGAGPSTAGNDLTYIKVVLRAAKSVQGLPVKPNLVDEARAACRELRLIGKSRQRDRTPAYEELAALDAYFERAALRGRESIPMREIMWFAIYSSRREDEITRLRRSDNELDRKLGVVRDAKHPDGAEGNHRRFRYTEKAWNLVQRQPVDPHHADLIFPFNARTISARFTRACKMLGIEDLCFHDLRHEATTRLFEQGLTIPEVAAHTLHESWSVLKRYTHLLVRGRLFDAPFLTSTLRGSGRSARPGRSHSQATGFSAHPGEKRDTGASSKERAA